MPLLLTTFPTTPLYDMRVVLDNEEFEFSFDYNGREDRWYFDIKDASGELLVRGVKVVPSISLLGQYALTGLPKGNLIASHALNDDDEAPGWEELGEDLRVSLLYVEEGEEL
jgi:hypothetical protein